MARKTKTLTVTIRCTVSDDQRIATVDSISAEGNIEDKPDRGEAHGFRGTDTAPTWDGIKTGATIVADCLAAFRAKYGT